MCWKTQLYGILTPSSRGMSPCLPVPWALAILYLYFLIAQCSLTSWDVCGQWQIQVKIYSGRIMTSALYMFIKKNSLKGPFRPGLHYKAVLP